MTISVDSWCAPCESLCGVDSIINKLHFSILGGHRDTYLVTVDGERSYSRTMVIHEVVVASRAAEGENPVVGCGIVCHLQPWRQIL